MSIRGRSATSPVSSPKVIHRFPRVPNREITNLLQQVRELELTVTLDVSEPRAAIVIAFPGLPDLLPRQMRDELNESGVSLSDAFQDILLEKIGGRTAYADLTRLAREIHRKAWLRFFDLAFPGPFSPEGEKGVKEVKNLMSKETESKRRGRLGLTRSKRDRLRYLYREYLETSTQVHNLVKTARNTAGEDKPRLPGAELERRISNLIQKDLWSRRGINLILNGGAFQKIADSRRPRSLCDPSTWTPKQLAIGLLACEQKSKYDTIARLIGRAN